MPKFSSARALKLVAVLSLALAAAACAKNPADDATMGLAGAGGAGGGRNGYGQGGAATPGSQQDFVINVGDRVFFESDSTELSPTAQATLDKQSAWLQQYSRYSFTVEGHADERGTREYNVGLGNRRAEVTKDYLIAHGISGSRIKTRSWGNERPVAVCNDNSCWSQNRRAVTMLGGAQS